MTIGIGILSIKGPDYHPSRRLAEAALARSARVVVINPYELALSYQDGHPVFMPSDRTDGLDAVLPRQGAEVKTASLAVIAHFEHAGVCVVNRLAGILKARNKYLTCQALAAEGVPVPETVYATSVEACHRAREVFAPSPAVIKPISGRQGAGIHRLDPDSALPPDIADELADGRGVLVQVFVPPQGRTDIRVFVVGGQVVGAASLTPPEHDFRSNFHVGSRAAPYALPDDLAALACRSARVIGLDIAGVDMIVSHAGTPMIVEVNYAPGFRGLEGATGIDIAGVMIDHVLSAIEART